MSDPGTSQLDWEGIFDRAHRRLFSRLVLLAAVGALGALLLLGGGLSARGTVRWSIGPFGNAKMTKSPATLNVDPKVAEAWRPEPSSTPDYTQQPKGDRDKSEARTSVDRWEPTEEIEEEDPTTCPDGPGSAERQYDDCLPEPTDVPQDPLNSGAEGPANGGTESIEETEGAVPTTTDQSGLADATPESSSP